MKKQSGFTLIELAIVLVIIGLLLGGVLKGQELINSAKVKNMANDFRNIQVAIYTYQDKFKALPGDDAAAVTHVGATNNGNGNGVIDGIWSDPLNGNKTTEAYNFWQHIRLAGLASGSTTIGDPTYPLTNADGGPVGVQAASTPSITGLSGSYVMCSGGVLGKFAKQLDATLDDGNTATGSMMAATAVDGVTAATAVTSTGAAPTIVDSNKYVVCLAF